MADVFSNLRNHAQNRTMPGYRPPKAKVARSNRVGSANLFNELCGLH